MTRRHFYSHGKLLITGEYAILDGAMGLAIPTTFGQSLSVIETNLKKLEWKSLDEQGNIWFESNLTFEKFTSDQTLVEKTATAATLSRILREARKLNPDFLDSKGGYSVETKLEFSRAWGLGSSSTLINNIALWAQVDPYELLWNSFGGSGYDIACARHEKSILYKIQDSNPVVTEIEFHPPFSSHLYFVHLGKKQNSREGISHYRKMGFNTPKLVSKITEITKNIVNCKSLSTFEFMLREHEQLLSETLQLSTVKETLFPDYDGVVKSLGAWGGDFVLVTGDNKSIQGYFTSKGYHTIIPFDKMVL